MQRSVSKEEANALSVRLELQADCLAGVWANRATRRATYLSQVMLKRRSMPRVPSAMIACNARARDASFPRLLRTARRHSVSAGFVQASRAATRTPAILSAFPTYKKARRKAGLWGVDQGRLVPVTDTQHDFHVAIEDIRATVRSYTALQRNAWNIVAEVHFLSQVAEV